MHFLMFNSSTGTRTTARVDPDLRGVVGHVVGNLRRNLRENALFCAPAIIQTHAQAITFTLHQQVQGRSHSSLERFFLLLTSSINS